MNWDNPVGIPEIQLHQELLDVVDRVVHRAVFDGVVHWVKAVINSMPFWQGQVYDQVPFVWLAAFGGDTKWAEAKGGGGG